MLIEISTGTSVAGVNLVSSQTHGTPTLDDKPACNSRKARKQAPGGEKLFEAHFGTIESTNGVLTASIRLTGTAAQSQKGIVTYGLAPNRQNPFAGAAHAAVFNTWRRASAQILYVVPPFIAAYYIMNWAIDR